MITATITIKTLQNGVLWFQLKSNQDTATREERLLAGVFDVAINKAGEMLIERNGNGEMMCGNIEDFIAPSIARAMRDMP